MGLKLEHSRFILVGPQDEGQIRDAALGLAPRLDYRQLAEQIGATIIDGTPPGSKLANRKPIGILRSLLANSLVSAKLLRRMPAGSVIFSTGETWGLPFGMIGAFYRRRQFKHIIAVHRVFSGNWRWLLRLLRPLLKADGWTCLTKAQENVLREILGNDARITVVCAGVDTHFFTPDLAEKKEYDTPYVLSIGAEMRDYALLFAATRHLNVPVVVKASSSWMKDTRDKIGAVPAHVNLIERRLTYNELRDLYAGAAVVVVPLIDTVQAAGINTILEGMAMGKCVIATRSAGLPDILVDKISGLIVDSNESELSRCVSDVFEMDGKCDDIVQYAYQIVREEASLEKHVSILSRFILSTSELASFKSAGTKQE